ncbi:predicted protein, partial [Nematostella vectensis]
QHPASCPCRFLTASDLVTMSESQNPKMQGVNVGVAVVLQSSDNQVLLTRRAEHMRTFPSVWVPPGGHLESGETLNQACLRELREETGLDFAENDLLISSLGLWESVYPPMLSMGLPNRHHIVVYLLAQCHEDSRVLQSRVKFCEHEVDAITWLDQYVVSDIASSDDYGHTKAIFHIILYCSALVKDKNSFIVNNLPLSTLMATLPPTSTAHDVERLSTGTKFALRQWLKVL